MADTERDFATNNKNQRKKGAQTVEDQNHKSD